MLLFEIDFAFHAFDDPTAEEFRDRLQEAAVDLAEELEIDMDELSLVERA